MKLLVIEDEYEINEVICRFFNHEGFTVEGVSTFFEARLKILDNEYDCVVLDLSLPDGDGLNLIPLLKRRQKSTSIIVVSARNTIADKINGLDLGADDYLAKPFSVAELNSRIRSVIRRTRFSGSQGLVCNELKVMLEERQCYVHGKEVVLTPKQFDLLCYFMMNKNRVLTKESIVEHLWGDDMCINAPSFDFIYTHIRNLRRKIVEAGGNDYIRSIYSLGYKFADV